tara:strand:- start:1953 stop:3929 length:1977 start_codon:yes stop_codon:yes gene_type:complete
MSFSYRPDIDGLRAVAVIFVVFYHLFPDIVFFGFIGVDIFFIISGYLITSLLLSNIKQNKFSFKEFYARRIIRLFPSLLVVLFLTFLVAWFFLLDHELSYFGKQLTAGTIFLLNFQLMGEEGYFNIASKSKPLLHLWSLSIEEQFYLLWPSVILLIYYFRKNSLNILLSLLIVFFSINIYLEIFYTNGSFYNSLARFWELILGAILGLYFFRDKKEYHSSSLKIFMDNSAYFGFFLIFIFIISFQTNYTYSGFWMLLPAFGSFLIILSQSNEGLVYRVLSNKFFVNLGLISYPLYLYHWPIIYFTEVIFEQVSALAKFTVFLVSLFFSFITFKFIEMPIRKNKEKILKNSIKLILLMFLFFLIGIITYMNYLPNRSNDAWDNISQAKLYQHAPRSWDSQNKILTPHYSLNNSKTDIVIFGDSHAEHYFQKINSNSKKYNLNVAYITAGGCPPFPNIDRIDLISPSNCDSFYRQSLQFIRENNPSKIIIAAYWDMYLLGSYDDAEKKGSILYDTNDDEKVPVEINSNQFRKIYSEFEKDIKILSEKSEVYIILTGPTGNIFDPNYILSEYSRTNPNNNHPKIQSVSKDEMKLFKKPLKELFSDLKKMNNINLIDPIDFLCSQENCENLINGHPLNLDKDHLSDYTVINHVNYLDNIFIK